jgi:peptidoglycan L-alanyl-D-glutamate endopeptidase CwlK
MSTELDPRTAKTIATLDPKAQPLFTKFSLAAQAIAAKHGCVYKGIGGNRTWAEQDALYAKGRTTAGPKVTNARGGYSNHNFGIAMDYGVFKGGKYLDGGSFSEQKLASQIHAEVGKLAATMGLDWGGNWKTFRDDPHFEVKTGLTLTQKREAYAKNKSVLK